ncbi:MAG: ribbon-helix-helix domain-containing protein [Clostridium sp.]
MDNENKIKRKNFNTTMDVDLLKKLRRLAFDKDIHICDLIEEGVKYVLDKYSNKSDDKL